MVDLHTHILPGIDDGASSLEETARMLTLAVEDGITDTVATPHCNFRYEFDPERCGKELKRVQLACPHAPRLYLGCELHLTPENIEHVLARPERYTLNGGDCLLVELPDGLTAAGIEAGLKACHRRGLRTIIAHPERIPYLQQNPSVAKRLVELGCYLQITAQSWSGSFGTAAQKSVARMFQEGLVHFVASDCHGAEKRRPLLRNAYAAIAREFGESIAELLFVLNPRSAVHGRPIERMRPALRGSTIFRLLNPASIFSKSRRRSATV